MARPRHVWYEREPRNKTIHFRISEALWSELHALSVHYETTHSELIRYLVSEAAATLKDGYQTPKREDTRIMTQSIKDKAGEIESASAILQSKIDLLESMIA